MNPTRVVLELPFPPSVNHYYQRTKFGMAVGLKEKQFRKEALFVCQHQYREEDSFGPEKRISMSMAVFAPDRRKRDLDNLGKCTLDFLTHAGVYADDSQIDRLEFRRMSVQPGAGRLLVTIEEIK